MTNAAIQEGILETLAETLGVDPLELSEATSAQNLAAWTSLAHLRLMANLEQRFGLEFTTDDMIGMTSVAVIAEVVEARGGA